MHPRDERSFPRLLGCLLCALSLLVFSACDQSEAPAPEDSGENEDAASSPGNCIISAQIPHDVAETDQTQPWFDAFSWDSFTALTQAQADGQGEPLWHGWSSTADYLNLTTANGGTPPPFGEDYYPEPCTSIEGYQSYRTIEQVGKVADSVFEANPTGLSNSPVVDTNGYFVRYEIVMNQDQYDFVTQNAYYDASNISGGTDQAHVNGTCGVNGDAEGVMNVKLAWMVINPDPDNEDSKDLWPRDDYITEELLIFDGAGTTKSGDATCSKMLMGLVGTHIAHKTESQPAWVWSTFEHRNNAPDCGTWPNDGADGGKNTSCPASVSQNWNFYGEVCNDGDQCQTCNETPEPNGGDAWYADQQPVDGTDGLSRLCRQVPVTADGAYSSAYTQNQSCQEALGSSVVANYELISTQWVDWTTAASGSPPITKPDGCTDVAGLFDSVLKGGDASTIRQYIEPQVSGTNTEDKPFLANTSMESYERSNCMGCHAKGSLTNPNCVSAGADDCKAQSWDGSAEDGQQGFLPVQGSGPVCGTASGTPCAPTDAYNFTDFSWWFAVEVPVDGVQ